MIRRMRGIVSMAKPDLWNDPFERLHQVFVRSFDRLSGRERSCRMKYHDVTETILRSELRKALFEAIGNVQNLLVSAGRDRNGDRGHNRSIGVEA